MPITDVDVPTDIKHVSILDENGKVDEDLEPEIPDADLQALYKHMVLCRRFDERRLKLQRQGRIGTFAPTMGQEAAQLGSIYALNDDDWFVPAFREMAAATWRGMKLDDDLLYAAGYEEGIDMPDDPRDMPLAIPVASQLTHAVGIAWARKLKGTSEVAIVYFGDGATSHGDYHEAVNWAPVFDIPIVFLNQNNQYAISVPRSRQTRAKTLAQRAIAYGMPGVQVDGNDILAVYHATQQAVDRARAGDGPTLIEALTYRLSVHTTADDPTKYRSDDEVETWRARDPITRFRAYVTNKGLWNEDEEDAWADEVEGTIDEAVKRFEERLQPDPEAMFEHHMSELAPYTKRQLERLDNRVATTGTREVD